MKVVIVGGGTAGWFAASHFAAYNKTYKLDNVFHLNYEITVVESPHVPIIGAGEGSTGIFSDAMKKLQAIEVDEIDFLYETESTLKLGIHFKNWKGDETSYLSPLGPSGTHHNNVDVEAFAFAIENRAYDASPSGYLQKRGLSSFRKNFSQVIPLHSYHFDAHKVGQYFKNKCVKHGVSHIIDHIVSIEKDSNGYITRLKLESGATIEGDLFIDCSGFSRVLAKAMDMGWESYSEYLPVNAALPYIHQYTEDEQIMPETLAWAQNNGWMWQIPTQTRYGCGYVYCDHFVTPDKALEELQNTTGRIISPLRNLKFETGRLKKFWEKNVIALGLSSSFLEPLQATSIHTTVVQIQMLLNIIHPAETRTPQSSIDTYNNYIGDMVSEFKDLLQIHYITGREDTEFWKFIKYELKHTEKTKFVLEATKHRALSFYDFSMRHGSAGWAVWAWTLLGLDIISKKNILRSINKHGLNVLCKDVVNVLSSALKDQEKSLLTNMEFMQAIRDKKFNPDNFRNRNNSSTIMVMGDQSGMGR